MRTTRAMTTSSRSTSGTCGARSTSRTAGTPSRPSAEWGTGWRPGVAERGGARRRAVLDRLGGVRVRAALAATVVVAVILAVSAVAFVLLQRRQLEATLTDVAAEQAAAVAGEVTRKGA